MKAEKRHQLQRNALADGVGRLLQGMKSAPTTRSTLAWVFVILTVGTVVVWQYGAFATQAHYSALWTQVDSASRDLASGGEKLRQLGEENRDSLPGRSARFQVARIYLERGQSGIRSFETRTEAVKSINAARELYKKLARECEDSPLLAQEAMMGIAQAEESLVGTPNPADPAEIFNLKQARESYQKLADVYPDSVLGQAAENRVKEIASNESEIERFYNDLNFWARRSKDREPEPKMEPPPFPTMPPLEPVPTPGIGTSGPELPLPNLPKSKASGANPGAPGQATGKEIKPPAPRNDAKPPAAKPENKNSKSK